MNKPIFRKGEIIRKKKVICSVYDYYKNNNLPIKPSEIDKLPKHVYYELNSFIRKVNNESSSLYNTNHLNTIIDEKIINEKKEEIIQDTLKNFYVTKCMTCGNISINPWNTLNQLKLGYAQGCFGCNKCCKIFQIFINQYKNSISKYRYGDIIGKYKIIGNIMGENDNKPIGGHKYIIKNIDNGNISIANVTVISKNANAPLFDINKYDKNSIYIMTPEDKGKEIHFKIIDDSYIKPIVYKVISKGVYGYENKYSISTKQIFKKAGLEELYQFVINQYNWFHNNKKDSLKRLAEMGYNNDIPHILKGIDKGEYNKKVDKLINTIINQQEIKNKLKETIFKQLKKKIMKNNSKPFDIDTVINSSDFIKVILDNL